MSATEKSVPHTQGPWEAELHPTSAGSVYKFPPTSAVLYVDRMFGRSVNDPAFAEAHANARLIAASPCLLAALKQMVNECSEVGSPSNGAMELALAAIAKAQTEVLP